MALCPNFACACVPVRRPTRVPTPPSASPATVLGEVQILPAISSAALAIRAPTDLFMSNAGSLLALGPLGLDGKISTCGLRQESSDCPGSSMRCLLGNLSC